ncbi:predicted protein [Chaetomium globosum CBS 148.51]|uniref:Uncharacterized protein n=1 Tax=Chaetomium globosum (strain ATCC 6205 / CBS 148.51 / DSM 1962 / NBRC 6347 / NRRL 1970) TaxID=306901 RepID=Q2GRR3_CHAGB|nr:uncharacterized protein CHGG_09341 [Chaetomium globosum CBS 148.51]EAQ85327.1 predicted protein [Chaetomium globosum CBS 148.51]
MCVQNLIALWCPCIPHACIRGTPGPYTRVAFMDEDYLSRTLCAGCMREGCSAPTEEPSAHGDTTRRFRFIAPTLTALFGPPKTIITTGGVAEPESSKKPKKPRGKTKTKKNGPAPLRVIDLREDDAADIARLKLQRAEKEQTKARGNTEGLCVLRSTTDTEFLFRPSGRQTPTERIAPLSPDGGEAGLNTPPLLVFDDDYEDEGNDADGEYQQRGDVQNPYRLPSLRPPPRPRG